MKNPAGSRISIVILVVPFMVVAFLLWAPPILWRPIFWLVGAEWR